MPTRLIAAFVVAFAAAGQPAPDAEKCTVEGRVADATTLQGIRKAEVILRRATEPSRPSGAFTQRSGLGTVTSNEGAFSFQGVDPGTYTLTVAKPGYFQGKPGSRRGPQGSMTLRLSPGQSTRDLTLLLTRQSVITGKVLDEDNDPVQGASVSVLSFRYFRGRRHASQIAAAMTDDRGEYRLHSLPPGKVMLMVAPMRQRAVGMLVAGQETVYGSAYYPGVPDIGQAARIEVPPGLELNGYDFRVQKTRVFRARGTAVHSATGQPLRNFYVSVLDRRGGPSLGAAPGISRNSQNGAFEISFLRPGSWLILAQATEGNERVQGFAALEMGEGDVEGLVVAAAPPQKLEGIIHLTGDPLPGFGTLQLGLYPAEGVMPGAASGVVNRDGTFQFNTVYPRRYVLEIEGLPEAAFVESVKLGGNEMLGRDLDLSSGVSGKLEIRISGGAGSIAGSVQNGGNPAPDATVVALPSDPALRGSMFVRTGLTAEDGSFRIGGLAPGDWLVLALDNPEEGAWEDPDFVKARERDAERVRLEKAVPANIRLKLAGPT